MSEFGTELARLMAERGTGVRELARACYVHPSHISNIRSGKARPSPELAAEIDRQLGAGGRLAALAPAAGRPVLPAGDRPRVGEIVAAVAGCDFPECRDLADAYRAETGAARSLTAAGGDAPRSRLAQTGRRRGTGAVQQDD